MDRVIDITNIRKGTYVREPDGALLLLHSPFTWNDPVYAATHQGTTPPDLRWRIVYGVEAEAVHQAYHLAPGEYIVEEL